MMKKLVVWVGLFSSVLLVAGSLDPCFAGQKKREKHVEKFPDVDLSAYSVLYVEDFDISDPKAMKKAKREAKAKMATKTIPDFVVVVLGEGVFDEVLREPMQNRAGAVALQANITTYKPGSAGARFVVAGAGKAKLHLTVKIIDAETMEELISFPITRTWAWGGAVGASKGIKDMDENVATELAMYLEECKLGE